MSDLQALTGARIFDGERWRSGEALLLIDGDVADIVLVENIPQGAATLLLDGGILAPGFVDLQVNGGGGVMLNDKRDIDAIRTICAAHQPFGTTSVLVTLITDTPEVTAEAVAACADALDAGVPGLLGLHLEGPHLSVARKGAHDPKLIRAMTDEDFAFLLDAKRRIPVLKSTVAVESVTSGQVARLAQAGITVSIGHSEATYADVLTRAEAGATLVTHLFNAMSQLGNREPGLVGAALDIGTLHAGLIADGIHVDAATIAVALRAKKAPGRIFLVSDAMSTIGTDMTSFELNGRTIYRNAGSLRLADGTLAGADLDMVSAVRFMHRVVGLPLEEALRMASLYPAEAIGMAGRLGSFVPGAAANIVHLSDQLGVTRVWEGGRTVFAA